MYGGTDLSRDADGHTESGMRNEQQHDTWARASETGPRRDPASQIACFGLWVRHFASTASVFQADVSSCTAGVSCVHLMIVAQCLHPLVTPSTYNVSDTSR